MRVFRAIGLVLVGSLVVALLYWYSKYSEAQSRVATVVDQAKQQKQNAFNPYRSTSPTGVGRAQMHWTVAQPNSRSSEQAGIFPPAENLPLNSIAASLRREADAGNAYSACRLAMELMRCSLHEKFEVPRMNAIAKESAARPTGSQPLGYDANQLEAIQQKYWTNANVCTGFKNSDELSADLYMLRAALLGHPGAMEFIATAPSIELASGTASMDAFVARREYSSAFLEQLAEQGNLNALISLAQLHAGRSWWHQLSLLDPSRTSYEDAAVFALAADIRQSQERALNPQLRPVNIFRFLGLDAKLEKPAIEKARLKAEKLANGFPDLDLTEKARFAKLKEDFPGADPKVLMCRK